jgi:hypothetical protein
MRWLPQTTVTIDDPETATKVLRLNRPPGGPRRRPAVYSNAGIPASLMEQIEI